MAGGVSRDTVATVDGNDIDLRRLTAWPAPSPSGQPHTRGNPATRWGKQNARVCLLDGFALRCGGRTVALPYSAQRLLAFLALHDRPVLRGYVAGSLYLDKREERASANLRSALWRLRQPGLTLVEAGGSHLSLADGVAVDVREAVVRARWLGDGDVADGEELDEGLFTGDLLPDWYDDWVITERERLRQLRLHALEALCLRLTALGRFARAIDVGLAAVAAEPLRESAHRAVIAAHLAEGNRGEALRQFDRYSALLGEALGLEPSPPLRALVAGSGGRMAVTSG